MKFFYFIFLLNIEINIDQNSLQHDELSKKLISTLKEKVLLVDNQLKDEKYIISMNLDY